MTRTHWLLLSAAVLLVVAATSSSSPLHQAPAAVAFPAVGGAGPLRLSAVLSSDRVLQGDSEVYVHVDVAAALGAQVVRQPLNLAIAIDQSGSMQGQKIEQARRAALALLDQLREGDHLALVAFSTHLNVFPSTPVSSDTLPRMREFISHLYPDGSTNISGALSAAFGELKRADHSGIARIVLLSDGQPNVGAVTAPALTALVDSFRTDGVSTSAFGVGLDFNGPLMQELAGHGGGSYAFIENVNNMGLALTNELRDASTTVARQVSLRLALPGGVELLDAPGHAFSREGTDVELPLYDFAPGQTAQVLLRLKVSGAPVSGAVKLGDLSVACVDVEKEKAVRSTPMSIAAEATADPRLVEAAAHADVVAVARKVDLNVQLAQATKAYEAGDTSKAFGLLDDIRRLFGPSANALAGDDLVAVRHSWQQGGDEGARANKSLTMKTMKNFGQNNAAQY